MKVLALDIASAKPIAYALWEDGRLKTFGTIEVLDLLRTIRRSKTPLTIATEHLYYSSQKRNIKMFTKLAKVLGAIEYAALEGGHDLVEVYASEWQAKILPLKNQFTKTEERERWAITIAQQLVREHLGEEREVNKDEASAICLGQYVSSREEFKELLEEVEDEH